MSMLLLLPSPVVAYASYRDGLTSIVMVTGASAEARLS